MIGLQVNRAGRSGKRILFATPEFADFIKVGGLGDVAASLPRAIGRRHDVRVVLPGYRQVLAKLPNRTRVGACGAYAGLPACEIARCDLADGLVVYVVVCPDLYERDGGPYQAAHGADFPDNDIRFARLSLAACDIAAGDVDPDWSADLVHANDWPTALTAAYLRWRKVHIPSIMTIHNLAHQGLFDHRAMAAIGAPDDAFQIEGVEFFNKVSFLKAGLFYATHLSTVSETYAREITTPEQGCGLDGLLAVRARQNRLTGILNGVDEKWDPRTDPNLFQNYEAGDWRGKRANALQIRKQFGLAVSRGPLFAVVSRLVHQKGIDLVLSAAESIVSAGGQVVVTGNGERGLERALVEAACRFPGAFAVNIGFDETQARNIFAASDFLLMPSRFEPCGLSQLYAQRFGSLPVAHRIGGLADTIADGRTGFLFGQPNIVSFFAAIGRAFVAFGAKKRLNTMRDRAMQNVAGWDGPADDYQRLYAQVIGNGRPAEA